MTWVIGGATIFGYGFALSDICVSFDGDKEIDCLQKVYPLSKFIVAGFSGSVELGFTLLEDLRRCLMIPQNVNNTAWIPRWVTLNWRRRARRIFTHAPEELKKLGCSILLVGVSPIENIGDTPFPKCTVSVLKEPDFDPKFSTPNEILSIGSGAEVEEYKEILGEFSRCYNPLMQLEVGHPRAYATAIIMEITRTLQGESVRGISKYLHVCIVQRGEILIGNNDFATYTEEGQTSFKMPKVATNWREFVEICKNRNLSSVSARAVGVL
jgi:hypothetical protein